MSRALTPTESQLLAARKLFESGRTTEAVQLIDATLGKQPDDIAGLLQAAQLLGQCYEISRAEAVLERVLEVGGTKTQAHVAQIFQQIFRPARAIQIFEQLHAEGKLALPSLAQLAKLYEQSNRHGEAVAALQECVDQAPGQPQPLVLLARVQRQAGDLTSAAGLLDTVVASAAPIPTLIHAWSELALVRDQQDDYDQSMHAIERAKALLRDIPLAQQQAKRAVAVSHAFQKLYSQIDAATIQAWSEGHLCDTGLAGVAHLTGFPRSGTTLLEQVLDAHPVIHAASERAVFTKAIFPAMCRNGPPLSLEAIQNCSLEQLNVLRLRYVQWHESIAGSELAGKVHLDKNPNHTSLLVGLYRLFPESKIVFALRDPRDVIVSTYLRFFSLSEFSASYLTWETTCALYAHEMNVWLKIRSLLPENWIEVKYEDTVFDLETTARKVTAHLGVDWDPQVLNYRADSGKFVYSPTHAEVRKPVYRSSVGRWRNYRQFLEPYLDRLEPFVNAFGYS